MTSSFSVVKRLLLASFIACSTIAGGAGNVFSAESTLTIGSTAPALDIEHWLSDGAGKFKPVTKFENGKVYVVEFWATWCPPCIRSMPHLVSLQKEFADKGVQIISVSDEPTETVNGFLEGEYKSSDKKDGQAGPKTYAELTSAYSLTTDPDGSTNESYMEAAGQNGIPCAFIVGKDQKIEWIGHPMELDEPLKAVVDGKWDREVYLKDFLAKQEVEKILTKLGAVVSRGKPETALKSIEEAKQKLAELGIKDYDDSLKLASFQVYLKDEKFAPQLLESIDAVLKLNNADPMFVNAITWTIYEAGEEGIVKDKAIFKKARESAAKAAESAEGDAKPAILDTVAHLLYKEGAVAEALKVQQQAVDLASDEDKEELLPFLEQLKKEAK